MKARTPGGSGLPEPAVPRPASKSVPGSKLPSMSEGSRRTTRVMEAGSDVVRATSAGSGGAGIRITWSATRSASSSYSSSAAAPTVGLGLDHPTPARRGDRAGADRPRAGDARRPDCRSSAATGSCRRPTGRPGRRGPAGGSGARCRSRARSPRSTSPARRSPARSACRRSSMRAAPRGRAWSAASRGERGDPEGTVAPSGSLDSFRDCLMSQQSRGADPSQGNTVVGRFEARPPGTGSRPRTPPRIRRTRGPRLTMMKGVLWQAGLQADPPPGPRSDAARGRTTADQTCTLGFARRGGSGPLAAGPRPGSGAPSLTDSEVCEELASVGAGDWVRSARGRRVRSARGARVRSADRPADPHLLPGPKLTHDRQ